MAEFYTHKAKLEQADALEMLREAARAALGLAADEGLGVGAGEGAGRKKVEGKKGGKKVEVGGKKAEGRKDKVSDKKADKKIVFVEVSEFDDDIRDEEPEEGDEEDEWPHQEL